MNKTNIRRHKKLNEVFGKVVHVTEEYDLPRYEVRVRDDFTDECEMTVEEIKDCCKLWVKSYNYSNLTNVELDEDEVFEGKSLAGDLASYQKFLDREFGEGEYEAFALGAYIHSGTSFSISKTGDHRCRFDSGTLGFIGLKKNVDDCYSAKHPEKVADALTAAWNGEYQGYEIYDNLLDDYVDSICDHDYNNLEEWKKSAKLKYDVEFDD